MKPSAPNKKLSKPRKGHRTKEQILAIVREFKKWAFEDIDDPKSRRLTSGKFFCLRSISDQTVSDWCEKYPRFNADYSFGKQAIGIKREEGMMRKELSEKSSMFLMHKYLPEWKYLIDREERWRQEDRDHQIFMLKMRADEAEGKLNDILEYFKTQTIKLPELHVKERTKVSSGDREGTTEV